MSATPQDANSANTAEIRGRLEYLRGELRAERISYGELAELQDLADRIAPDDVELLETAGVPEFADEKTTNRARLLDAIATLEEIAADPAISPTPGTLLDNAAQAARDAAHFPLDAAEATA